MQRGSTTAAVAAMDAAGAVPAAIVGLLLPRRQDPARREWLAALGFLVTLGSVIGLTFFAEPQKREEPEKIEPEPEPEPVVAGVRSHRANGHRNGTNGHTRPVLNGHTPPLMDLPRWPEEIAQRSPQGAPESQSAHPALSEKTAELPILKGLRQAPATRG